MASELTATFLERDRTLKITRRPVLQVDRERLGSKAIRPNRNLSVTPAEVPGSTERFSLEREEARHGGCRHFGRHDDQT
jgi:hypothetical protein